MPRLSNVEKARAIGQIEAGVPQKDVAALFGVSPGTISKWKAKFQETGDVKDRPRSGRPKKKNYAARRPLHHLVGVVESQAVFEKSAGKICPTIRYMGFGSDNKKPTTRS